MNCDCVEDEITVVRRINKALRTTNHMLRQQLQTSREQIDDMFNTLCAMDSDVSPDSGGLLDDGLKY